MAGKVPEHVKQQIVRSTDITRLIGNHCRLIQRGKKFVAICPFHKEKTPSFTVDPEQGLYYCFGCQEGGDVFTWLKKVDGLEFPDALQMLARDAGVDLSQYQDEGGPTREEFDALHGANELAATYYQKCLQKARGADRARDYVKGRKINDESVERWRIGYAPADWEHFLQVARKRGFAPTALREAGLALERTGAEGHYLRFRDRLMFPVGDRNGRVIGFGARALSQEDEPKYLNSPEGPLFSKGRCFYGFAQARHAVRAEKTAVIVEGYTDVIMAHQFGVENVMAVLGTAFTEYHARTLGALCERVILALDPDEAGQKSASRSIEVLMGEDIDVRVARLEVGEDPCDFLLARGADAFRERLANSEDFVDFRLRRARETHDVSTVHGRTKAFEDMAELAMTVRNEAKRDMLIRRMAGELGIAERSAWAYLERSWIRGRRRGGPAAGENEESVKRDDRAPTAGLAAASELLDITVNNKQCQEQAADEFPLRDLPEVDDPDLQEELPECEDRELLGILLEHCRRSGPVAAGEFVSMLTEPDKVARVARAVAHEQERLKMIALTPQQRYEGLRDYLLGLRQQRRKHELMWTTTTTTAAPSMTTTTPGGATDDEDERLRAYMEMRLREDSKAAGHRLQKEGQ